MDNKKIVKRTLPNNEIVELLNENFQDIKTLFGLLKDTSVCLAKISVLISSLDEKIDKLEEKFVNKEDYKQFRCDVLEEMKDLRKTLKIYSESLI